MTEAVAGEQVQTVVVGEHARSAPVRLSAEGRSALFAVADDKVKVLATADPQTVVLETTSWVGSISVPGLQIRITPAAPMHSLFAMLAGLGDEVVWGQGTSGFASDELLDGSALAVLRAIEAATRRGLLHGYQSRQEPLATIRGRLLVEEIARRPWTAAQPECRYDDFTADIEENRVLAAAVRVILTGHGLSPSTRRRAVELLARFEGVGSPSAAERATDIVITRLNEHYEQALDLARLALDGFAIRHEEGVQQAHAFLLDVEYVFLRFVAGELRSRLWPGLRVEQTEQLDPGESSGVQANADVLVSGPRGPVLVLGTCYHLGTPDAVTSDVTARALQRSAMPPSFGAMTGTRSRGAAASAMTAIANDAATFFPVVVQASSLGLANALVVYAHAARRPASRIRIPGTGTDVHARHIDLEQTWPEIQQQLDSLADTVRRLAA